MSLDSAKEISIDAEIVAVLSKLCVTGGFSLTYNATSRTEGYPWAVVTKLAKLAIKIWLVHFGPLPKRKLPFCERVHLFNRQIIFFLTQTQISALEKVWLQPLLRYYRDRDRLTCLFTCLPNAKEAAMLQNSPVRVYLVLLDVWSCSWKPWHLNTPRRRKDNRTEFVLLVTEGYSPISVCSLLDSVVNMGVVVVSCTDCNLESSNMLAGL